MAAAHLEVLVEPFRENQPGRHVRAVIDCFNDAGLTTEMGPFATTADGDIDAIADAVGEAIRAGIRNGATALQFRIEVAGG